MDTERAQIRTMSGLNILLGAWLIIAPWVLNYTTGAAQANSVLLGIGIIGFAAVRESLPRMNWSSWVNAVFGLWLVISPFILQIDATAAYWNLIIVGVMVAAISMANASTYVSRARS